MVSREKKWYIDKPTLVALISGAFSTLMTLLNVLRP